MPVSPTGTLSSPVHSSTSTLHCSATLSEIPAAYWFGMSVTGTTSGLYLFRRTSNQSPACSGGSFDAITEFESEEWCGTGARKPFTWSFYYVHSSYNVIFRYSRSPHYESTFTTQYYGESILKSFNFSQFPEILKPMKVTKVTMFSTIFVIIRTDAPNMCKCEELVFTTTVI